MRLLVVSTRLTKDRLAAFASLVNDDDDITVIEADNRLPPFDEYDAVVLDGVASAPGPEVTDGRPVVLIPPATDAPLGEYFVKPVAGEISTRLPDEFPIFDRFQPVLVDTPAATVIAHVNVAFRDEPAVGQSGNAVTSGLGLEDDALANRELGRLLGRALRRPRPRSNLTGLAGIGYGPHGGMGYYHGLAA